jgi:hypothetical protein
MIRRAVLGEDRIWLGYIAALLEVSVAQSR